MNLVCLFVISLVLQVVVISAKFYRTPVIREECTSQFGTNTSRSPSTPEGACKRGWRHFNISTGNIQQDPSIKDCRYYIQKSLSNCKGSESQACDRHMWRAYVTSPCFDSWMEISSPSFQHNNSQPCFRFRRNRVTKRMTVAMTSRCVAASTTTAAWSEWRPIATGCDVTCRRQWRRQCMSGSKAVRPERCDAGGAEREWRSCDDCAIARSRRDQPPGNTSDVISVMPRSRYKVPPVQEQADRGGFGHGKRSTAQSRYFSYWPGFATGFACCCALVAIVIVSVKAAKSRREKRMSRRRNELRLYYAKPNQAWQMKLSHPAQTSVKSRTAGHVDAKVAGARCTGEDVSNADLYPTVCHHDSGYQADDETNEKRHIVPSTSPKSHTPHERVTSPAQKVTPKCRDVMASYDSCCSAEGSSQQQQLGSNRSSPFISFLKIHGDDEEDGNDLPLVPYSYRLRLTAKQRAPATPACYRPEDLVNDQNTTSEVKNYGTDMSSN